MTRFRKELRLFAVVLAAVILAEVLGMPLGAWLLPGWNHPVAARRAPAAAIYALVGLGRSLAGRRNAKGRHS